MQALAGEESVTPRLAALVRKELIRPERAQLAGDDGFRFRHLLIRDAAYDALPKATRADLHERFAEWLEHNGRALVELDEILGYHAGGLEDRRTRRRLSHETGSSARLQDAEIEPNRCPNGARVLDEDPGEPDYVEAVDCRSDRAARWSGVSRDAAMAPKRHHSARATPNLRPPVPDRAQRTVGAPLPARRSFRITR